MLAVLWWGTSAPAIALMGGAATFDDLIALTAAALAWPLAGWIFLMAIVSALARLPGHIGRAFTWCAARITPPAVRRVARTLLGLTMATVPLTVTVPAGAIASPPHNAVYAEAPPSRCGSEATRARPLPGVGRPAVAAPQPRASVGGPVLDDAEPRGAESADHPAGTDHENVVVEKGATLWSIAASHLGPDATPEQIAAEWPRWYATNQDRIGADPDVIRPGIRLSPPEDT
jgi:hypothetical protein